MPDRAALEDALRWLDRAGSCERRGMVYRDGLDRAAAALRRAGMPEHAAIAEDAADRIGGDDTDIERLRDALAALADMRVIGELGPMLEGRGDG